MARAFILVAWTTVLAGCARSERCVVLSAETRGELRANLVLARSAETARLAPLMAERSDWPSVDHGYRSGDVTYYSRIIYDDQSYYDRYTGFSNVANALQTGVLLR